jgi:hypothetical protein
VIAFAGPLCRCFALSEAAARALLPGVQSWRRELVRALGDRLPALDWPEDPAEAGVAEDLGDAGWAALRLFAVYAERSELELPDTVPPLPELDRAFRGAQEERFARSRYGHLLACTVWLPGDFPLTVRAPLPDGEPVELGSLAVLHDQLRWLNQRTFAADAGAVAAWRELPAPAGGELLAAARRGFAALSAAVQWARAHGLPVLLREKAVSPP